MDDTAARRGPVEEKTQDSKLGCGSRLASRDGWSNLLDLGSLVGSCKTEFSLPEGQIRPSWLTLPIAGQRGLEALRHRLRVTIHGSEHGQVIGDQGFQLSVGGILQFPVQAARCIVLAALSQFAGTLIELPDPRFVGGATTDVVA